MTNKDTYDAKNIFFVFPFFSSIVWSKHNEIAQQISCDQIISTRYYQYYNVSHLQCLLIMVCPIQSFTLYLNTFTLEM